jgi:hypothetical protein
MFALAACTLLATFDDGMTSTGISQDGSVLGDASGDSLVLPFPEAGDGSSPVDGADADTGPYAPCDGLLTGAYCATNGPHGYQGPPSDLLHCVDGGIGSVVSCDGGCLSLSNPFPDTCNGCNTMADGEYCGRDFPTFPSRDSEWLVQCHLGNAVQLVACAHGCNSNGTSSACAP